MNIKPGSKPRVKTEIITALARRILSGELLPGAYLPTEADLCKEYGVSRTVIREAAKVLEAKGLLSIRSRVGTQILERESWNLLDPDMIVWSEGIPGRPEYAGFLMEVQQIIEPAAAALAAQRASALHLDALENAFQRMVSFQDADNAEFVKADADFHNTILAATGNHFFMQLGKAIYAASKSLFRRAPKNKRLGRIIELHRDVLSAIQAHDSTRASRSTTLIIETALQDLDVIMTPAASRLPDGLR